MSVTDKLAQTRKEKTGKGTERDERTIARKRAILRWWVGTVFLTLFPTLATTIVILLQSTVYKGLHRVGI